MSERTPLAYWGGRQGKRWRRLDAYFVASAASLAALFLVAEVLTRVLGSPRDLEFSAWEMWLIGVGFSLLATGISTVMLAVAVLVRRWFQPDIVFRSVRMAVVAGIAQALLAAGVVGLMALHALPDRPEWLWSCFAVYPVLVMPVLTRRRAG
ncbi:MAG TPA: hypothetical protein VHQ47_13930 [Phycisphaerae bacterium]|nr:hypothetical protein [Phycisphaerae bacterium]